MKKKKDKLEKQYKKEKKQALKKKKEMATTLDWMDIIEIKNACIYLKDGYMVKGIRLQPRNIFLDTAQVQSHIINNIRVALNKITFRIYWGFVFTPVEIDDHLAALLTELDSEDDPVLKSMIENDLEKAYWFIESHRELEFFLFIKEDDERELQKKMDILISEITRAGFSVKELDDQNFSDYLAYVHENSLINDYYYSRGIFSCLQEIEPTIIDEVHEAEFNYDDYSEEDE